MILVFDLNLMLPGYQQTFCRVFHICLKRNGNLLSCFTNAFCYFRYSNSMKYSHCCNSTTCHHIFKISALLNYVFGEMEPWRLVLLKTFARNSNSAEYSFYCNFFTCRQIAMNFCTCHDSRAFVSYADFVAITYVRIKMRAKWNCHRIWIAMEIQIQFTCRQIAMNFCTCHDSRAFVSYADFVAITYVRIKMRAKWNCDRIWIAMEKLSEMGDPGTLTLDKTNLQHLFYLIKLVAGFVLNSDYI